MVGPTDSSDDCAHCVDPLEPGEVVVLTAADDGRLARAAAHGACVATGQLVGGHRAAGRHWRDQSDRIPTMMPGTGVGVTHSGCSSLANDTATPHGISYPAPPSASPLPRSPPRSAPSVWVAPCPRVGQPDLA
jgi:hypothetical protein